MTGPVQHEFEGRFDPALFDERIAGPGMSVEVVTFGCRLNAYELEVIRQKAQAAHIVDTVVINTCAVTAEAVRQSRQTIRRMKRERPGSRIVVTGCAAQIEPNSFAEMPEVALVLGNEEKLGDEALAGFRRERQPVTPPSTGKEKIDEKIKVNDIMAVTQTAAHLTDGFEGRVRAFVAVQNGCDHRCTFCIIPYCARQFALRAHGRGRARGAKPVRIGLSRGRSHRR